MSLIEAIGRGGGGAGSLLVLVVWGGLLGGSVLSRAWHVRCAFLVWIGKSLVLHGQGALLRTHAASYRLGSG